jgi:hypothetical protein
LGRPIIPINPDLNPAGGSGITEKSEGFRVGPPKKINLFLSILIHFQKTLTTFLVSYVQFNGQSPG